MKLRLLLATFLLILLSCIPGVSPRTRSINVVYIGSIWDDINREKPFCAAATNPDAIALAHTLTEPPFMEYYLHKMGLHELLNTLAFDFVIGDTLVYGGSYFPMSRSMGYAIKNFGGIRFAMICSAKDSLTMEDRVTLSLLKERSDILWVINKPLLEIPPSLIKLNIRQRALTDTSISAIKAKEDTVRTRLVRDFTRRIEKELNREIIVAGSIADHVLSTVAQNEQVDVILFPEKLFLSNDKVQTLSLRKLIENVAFETKFRKAEMKRAQISEFCNETGCLTWGEIKQTNSVLIPDEKTGNRIFDYYHGR
ncbi:MAG: hypothetical protein JSV98_00275 [candidate division WOR-3 bacterium]|nr:MAG: hypothetical protein JSV98_00275 [candidate division WOR-3 bacterium]